jgi:hypothetical protein
MEHINLPVIELSYVELVQYEDGNFHLSAHYLFQIGRNEELVGEFNGSYDHIRQLPLITPETRVTVRTDRSGETIQVIQMCDVPSFR